MRILCVIGTRPEVIKMAPIIWEFKKHPHIKVTVLNTAQHRDLLDDMLELFDIHPGIDMNIMQENQTLTTLTGNLFLKMSDIIKKDHFDFVVAQGDTTTTLVAAQVAFYNRIPYGHVEAGLRTFDMYNPFPEEMNRVFISKIARLHFAPTHIEQSILLKEGIDEKFIFVTGNTVIDSLYHWAKKKIPLPFTLPSNKRIILLTLHRRESFGDALHEMFAAFLELVEKFSDIHIMYPVHPNPNVNQLAHRLLGQHPSITLLKPLRYDILVQLLNEAYLVCTDSGGLQEEAPALNKPLLVLREETERSLVVSEGVAKLVGTKKIPIVQTVSALLTDKKLYQSMQKKLSPYGDGHASERIVEAILANTPSL